MVRYRVPKRIQNVEAEAAFAVLSIAKRVEAAGRKVAHLEIGDAGFDTPDHIKEAAVEALKRGETHYTPTVGIPELRQAIAESVKRDYGVEVDWNKNVVVTSGCKQAVLACMLSILDEGDEALYPNPGYPEYEAAAYFAGAKPIPYRLTIEDEFRVDPDKLAELITPKTKLVVINTPHNPCGSIMSREEVKALVDLAIDHGFYILSDEVYRPFLYDGEQHHSPLEVAKSLDQIIIADGFSKRYAMTGWRIGYALIPEEIQPQVFKLLNVMTSCPNSISQWAALAALKGPQEPVYEMKKGYERRRNLAIEELSKIEEVRFVKPKGAFYAMIDVSKLLRKLSMNSEEFVKMLIEKYGVAFLHGTALGSYGEGYIRLSFSVTEENILYGLRRFRQAVEDILRS
ncbi:MAG: pyridoxal phosphate-dependent aminotransferase [Thaumarchaeota archaeon]|nr:MAG: pyridoxal phosphate-dependent aminotransferase [Nitrososphaerota archaeon]